MKGIKNMHRLSIFAIFLLLIACDTKVTSSVQDTEQFKSSELPLVLMNSQEITKTPISGTVVGISTGLPERNVITPGGPCHFYDLPVYTEFTGDLEGSVVYYENVHQRCTGGRLVASGPFEGEITWNGRTGTVSGQFTTNCKPDPSQPTGVSCDGTSILQGSGDLEGVQFHYKWGPGWYPFPYSGTAYSK